MLALDLITIVAHVALGTLAVAMGAVALSVRKGRTFLCAKVERFTLVLVASSFSVWGCRRSLVAYWAH